MKNTSVNKPARSNPGANATETAALSRPGLNVVAVALAVALVASVLAIASLQSSASGQRQDVPEFVTGAGDEVMIDGASYQVRMAGQEISRPLPVAEGVFFGGRNLKAEAPSAAITGAGAAGSGRATPGLAVPQSELWIVQFSTVPLDAYSTELAQLGAQVGAYVPDHARIVRMSADLAATVTGLRYVQWVGRYTSDLKVAEPTARAMASTPDQTATFLIRLFDESPATRTAVTNSITKAGGINDPDSRGLTLTASMTFGAAAALLPHNGVQFLEQVTEVQNDTFVERATGGANQLEGLYGYDGTNVGIHVFDDGVLANHQQFNGLDLLIESNVSTTAPNTVSHGTSSVSIIAGNGVANPGTRGIAPDARVSFSTRKPDVNTPFVTARDRLQLASLMVDPAQPYRAVVSVAPWGSVLTSTYTVVSADLDNATFVTDLLTVQSQGNDADSDPLPSFRPQASAKNVVSVGGISMFGTASTADDIYRNPALISASTGDPVWASRGPSADGRIKPDLVFANDGTAAATVLTEGSRDDYVNFPGTSASSVATAGYFGLLYEMWADGIFAGTPGLGRDVFDSRMRMATAKAIAINTAFRYDFQGINSDKDRYRQGWGRISLDDAAQLAVSGNMPIIIDETDLLQPFGRNSYEVGITDDPNCVFRTTMVYTDPAGTPGASRDRVNDLSLRLTSPSGLVYWGNNGLTQSNLSTSGGASNRIDTVENVFLANPQAGVWTIDVLGDEIIEDGHPETAALDADYALISSGECVGAPGPQPGSIVGTLWRDDNGDRSNATAEPGLAGVQVQLLDPSGAIADSTATAADGSYTFASVPVGDYTILIVPSTLPNDAGATADPDGVATENQAAVTMTDQALITADFGWQIQTVALGNRIFEDTNFNGVLDANETGIGASITVALQDSTGNIISTKQTDADGWFFFDRLEPGTYRLAIPNFELLAGGAAASFDSTIGDANPNNNQDNDDNAAVYSGVGLRSQDITLTLGSEPTGEDTGPIPPTVPDVNSNLTVDIGLFPSRD